MGKQKRAIYYHVVESPCEYGPYMYCNYDNLDHVWNFGNIIDTGLGGSLSLAMIIGFDERAPILNNGLNTDKTLYIPLCISEHLTNVCDFYKKVSYRFNIEIVLAEKDQLFIDYAHLFDKEQNSLNVKYVAHMENGRVTHVSIIEGKVSRDIQIPYT